MHHPREW